jgi:glycosyltransferase involved in cell wall biosynthesis
LVDAQSAPVDMVGFVPSIWDELTNADLLLMPSRKEGFGLASLQALSAGVPVVLSSRAGFAEQVTRADGCVLAPPEIDATVTAIRAALDDLESLTAAARRFAEKRAPEFTYDTLLEVILTALEPPR